MASGRLDEHAVSNRLMACTIDYTMYKDLKSKVALIIRATKHESSRILDENLFYKIRAYVLKRV